MRSEMKNSLQHLTRVVALAGISAFAIGAAAPAMAQNNTVFKMVRSANLPKNCAPHADALVRLKTLGFAELMTINVRGLPPHTGFDAFVIQVPNFPFGLSWYIGDIETDGYGSATKSFVSRFSQETFAVAPKEAPAPKVDKADAPSNPAFAPVHTFHVGIWFNSPADAAKVGCPNVVTPFNGEHNAGPQILSTRTLPDNAGPLRRIK